MNACLETPRRWVQRLSLPAIFITPRDGGLLRRTFLIAFMFVSGGLIVGGMIELYLRNQESVESIRALQQEMAEGAAFKIQQYVETITHTLRTASQTSEIVTEGITDDYGFQLRKLLRVLPAVTTVTVLDPTGREKLKVSRVRTFSMTDLLDRSTDEAFMQALTGSSVFGQVYFVRQSEPYMRITVPIELFADEVVGVLMAEVNLKYIWDVISGISVGETGYAYVISSQGDLIAHPDISLALQKLNLKHLTQVQAALAGTQSRDTQQNLQGEKVFSTHTVIPTLGWVVFVERLTDEAYSKLYSSLRRLGLFLLLGVGMSWLASWLISRRVLRPLEKLRLGAEKFGAGELDHRIDLHTGNELEELASTFNRMAEQLEMSYTDLERKVEARTQELALLVGELENASFYKSQFLAHMSHELRTPLSAIMTFTKMTLENQYGDISERARERLERVYQSAEHLLNLIKDLLDISKIEAGRYELEIVPYSMLSLVETVATFLESQAKEKQLQLIVITPPDLPIGLGDESRLTQVLINLVSNAITYTEAGEIEIGVEVSKGNFTMTVTDTGPGIAPADQHRIFESFEQAHESKTRVRSGAGLGLSISKTIVEMHGGSIGVQSSLGEGSVFWCTFPVRVSEEKEGSWSRS